MLKAQPAEARYLHEAHAITRAQLEALEAAGALLLAGADDEAHARLAKTPTNEPLDRTTPLDVIAVSEARARAIAALKSTAHADAIEAFASLSLAPRDVSEQGEMIFVARALRLENLIQFDAPRVIIENELVVLQETMLRLDSLQVHADPEDEPCFLPDEEIARFSDPRFALSLQSLTAVLDAVADFHREERPADGSEVFALGGPLLEIDFANPPQALLERAIRERGVWDEEQERADTSRQAYGAWLDWMVVDDLEGIDNLREMMGVLRVDLLEVPRELREQLVDTIACEFAPMVTCEDWIPVLDARLVAFEDNFIRALEEGLVVVSRVKRNDAY